MRSTQQRRPGAAAVELAVVLPVMVTIILGCIDFGRFAYTYVALANAARAGAAYAVNHSYFTAAEKTAWNAGIVNAAREEMKYQTGYDSRLLKVLTYEFTDNVSTTNGGGERRVKVVTHYPLRTLVPWLGIPDVVEMQGAVNMPAVR